MATDEGRWEGEEFVMDLEKDKKEVAKLKVRKFNGNVYVDVRKYYDDGTKPTTKGISLRPDLFEKLLTLRPVIEESVELVEKRREALSPQHALKASTMRENDEVSVSIELDRGHQVRVSKFKQMTLVDIRSFYNGGPTKKGISLAPEIIEKVFTCPEWKAAVAKLK